MKTLYLHGMGGRPKEWQLQAMIDIGLEPYALHLDYSRVDEWEILSHYIEKEKIEFLIGRSHGGYLSYWLSEQYGLPSLIINPHFSIRSRKQMQPPVTHWDCPICLVVLGTDDLVVDSERSLLFLEKDENKNKILKIKMLEGIGHGIDADTYSELMVWALSEINNLKKPIL